MNANVANNIDACQQVDKRTMLDNLELVLLTIDEVVRLLLLCCLFMRLHIWCVARVNSYG